MGLEKFWEEQARLSALHHYPGPGGNGGERSRQVGPADTRRGGVSASLRTRLIGVCRERRAADARSGRVLEEKGPGSETGV